jgi:hypothetical protein
VIPRPSEPQVTERAVPSSWPDLIRLDLESAPVHVRFDARVARVNLGSPLLLLVAHVQLFPPPRMACAAGEGAGVHRGLQP